jgi:hypothetical protein
MSRESVRVKVRAWVSQEGGGGGGGGGETMWTPSGRAMKGRRFHDSGMGRGCDFAGSGWGDEGD